jgi:hypothetical protein
MGSFLFLALPIGLFPEETLTLRISKPFCLSGLHASLFFLYCPSFARPAYEPGNVAAADIAIILQRAITVLILVVLFYKVS